MSDETAYVKGLAAQGALPTGSGIIRDLIENLDAGLSGSRLNLPNGDTVWISTHDQVTNYLVDFAKAYEEHERENALPQEAK